MTILDVLEAHSRPARPTAWSVTLWPLAVRASELQDQLDALRREHLPLTERLAVLDLKRLEHVLVPAAFPLVGQLVRAAREARDRFDSSFVDLRDALRAAAAASSEPAFSAAVTATRKYLARAESTVLAARVTARHVIDLVGQLDAMPTILSESFVVPMPVADGGFSTTITTIPIAPVAVAK